MKRRNVFLGLLLLVLLVGGGAAGVLWWQRRSDPPPQPPVVDLSNQDDPDLANAIETIRQGVLREPRSAESWGKLGKVLLANGYRDESLPCFEQATRLAPTEARWPYFQGLAQRLNNLDAALVCFRQAARLIDSTSPHAVEIRLRYAEALLLAGNPQEAKPLLQELLQLEPDNPRVHLALGSLALDGNDLDSARTHLLRCAEHPLTRQRAATHLATLSLRQGDAESAERYRQRARRLHRDPEGSDPFVEEYLALTVGREARFLHAEYFLIGGETRKAIDMLEPLVAAHPDAVEAQVKLAMAWAKLGNYRQAESILRKTLTVRPDMVQAHYFLCVALFHQAEQSGDRAGFEAAADEARKALAVKPDHAFAHLYLGLVLRKLGRSEEALTELRTAARISPETTDPHLHLGEALLESGAREEGLAQLEKAAEVADEEDFRPRQALKKWRQ